MKTKPLGPVTETNWKTMWESMKKHSDNEAYREIITEWLTNVEEQRNTIAKSI